MKFHALVLTLDEERQIGACLASLAAAESLVVLDSGSRDRTRELAASFPRTRVLERPFDDFAAQRNFGLATAWAPDDWVLHLDADERATPALVAELRGLAPGPQVLAYNLAARTYLDGRSVSRAAGFPVYQTRLTRGCFRFEQVGHGQKAPAALGPLPCLGAAYEHHPFDNGFERWHARHLAYARQEAYDLLGGARGPGLQAALRDAIARRQWWRHASARWALRPALVWLFLMFVRRGVLDGPPGWEYCRRRWLYERMVRHALRAARAG